MNHNQSEVVLTLDLRGTQATSGLYTHYHKVDKDGKELNGITTVKPVTFNDCKKSVRLSNEFVKGALAQPPEDMKDRFKKNYWVSMPAAKRISIHVRDYVRAMHPENRGYAMEII